MFSHHEILYFVGPESVAELIRSSDDHRSYFLLSGSQDFADFEGKKYNLSNLQKCPYLRNPLSYTHDLLRENRLYQERSGEKIWSSEDESDQPNQPNQPTR